MRTMLAALLACGCVDRAASTGDGSAAPTCSATQPQLPTYCVTGGLAGLPFDATTGWTMTGTIIRYGRTPPGDPITTTTTIVRDGDGCDHLSIFGYGPAGVIVDDTSATMYLKGTSNGYQTATQFSLCVDGSGALRYHEVDTTFTEGTDSQTIDGTLVHA